MRFSLRPTTSSPRPKPLTSKRKEKTGPGDNQGPFWVRRGILQSFAVSDPLYEYNSTNKLSDLDLFDKQDSSIYTTNAHHCLLQAVEKLMLSLSQNPYKIDRKARGFLGIL